ncbi:MAG: TlpA family protein disulfide reductase [Deltaproteobacteria bacterium]|nr:MAG: TlpA family protein disulfide reductase [Deltaproteobacteria bacterium]
MLLLLASCTPSPLDPEASATGAQDPASSAPASTTTREEPSIERLDAEALRDRLASPADKVRVVNFWAMWCAPCKAEMPALTRFASARPDIELIFVNLDHPRAPEKRLYRYLQEQSLVPYAHLRPAEGENDLTSKLDEWPDVLPVTWILAQDGTTRARLLGAIDEQTLTTAVGVE